ncbi:MAG TPA: F0F1 ATP synthase subunit epsilon, partial [Acidimicrobiales bacterium]
MAGAAMRVELVSPERVVFSGEATMVITRVLDGGDIAFMAGHAPYLGALVECHTRIELVDGRVQDVAVHGGFVEVSGNKVSLLTDLAELGENIDVDRARRA